MELQRHVRRCINTGRQLKLIVQRLSEEQILTLTKRHSDDSRRPNCHGEHLNSAEFLHPAPIPKHVQCTFKNCALIFPSSEEMKEHKEIHYQAVEFRCKVCNKLISTKKYLKHHLERHTQLRTFDCDVPGCSYSGVVSFDLQRHKKRVHTTSIMYECLMCGKNFKQDYFYKLHVAKHNTDTPGVFKCLYMSCQKLFENEIDIRKHTEAHKDLAQFDCNECGKCFALKRTLASHVVMHWDWRPFKCDIPGCSYSAKWSQHLQKHKNNVHTLERLTCSLCGEMFKHRAYFKEHEEKHKTDTPGVFKCHHIRCNETFSIPKNLKMHTKQHKMHKCDVPGCLFTSELKRDLCVHRKKVHSICVHNCQLCGKGFDNNTCLKQHVKIHKTGEPGVIKCAKNNCKQTFKSVADFKKHFDNHESLYLRQNGSKRHIKEFECHCCGKNIKGYKSDLKKHVAKHETKTPGVIKCLFSRCKQTFTSATDLKQHYLKHWDVSLRPFACDFPQCNYASRKKRDLLQHKRQVHSPNLYTCDMCGRKFKNLSYVARHFKSFHLKQLNAENPKSTIQRPNSVQEHQELICKDEIEEVVFD
jgi:KRAB domain-containing zinc finger protein